MLWFFVSLLHFARFCQRPNAFPCYIQIFALNCLQYLVKSCLLFNSAGRRLLAGLFRCLLVIVQRLNLCPNQLRDWFYTFHKRGNWRIGIPRA